MRKHVHRTFINETAIYGRAWQRVPARALRVSVVQLELFEGDATTREECAVSEAVAAEAAEPAAACNGNSNCVFRNEQLMYQMNTHTRTHTHTRTYMRVSTHTRSLACRARARARSVTCHASYR